MIKQMLTVMVMTGLLTPTAFASTTGTKQADFVDSMDWSYVKPIYVGNDKLQASKSEHNQTVKDLKKFLKTETTPEEQKTFAFYANKTLADGYVVPNPKVIGKSFTYKFVYRSMFDKDDYKANKNDAANSVITIFQVDPHLETMLRSAKFAPNVVSNNLNEPKLSVEDRKKIDDAVMERGKEYAARLIALKAMNTPEGVFIYLKPEDRQQIARNAYITGAMKYDNDLVKALDTPSKGKKLSQTEVAIQRNKICLYLKEKGIMTAAKTCHVNSPLTTKDYIASGAPNNGLGWATDKTNVMLADKRMKGVYVAQ